MKSNLVKLLVIVIVPICFSLAAIIYWNTRFDAGAAALKVLDYRTAIERLEPLATLGDPNAQFIVGELYAFGLGVAKDDEQAITWFRKSGWENHGEREQAAPAEYYVAQEYAEAGGLVERDHDEAIKWLKRAAEGGHKPAAVFLAKAYSEGLLGLSQDSSEARFWLEKVKPN